MDGDAEITAGGKRNRVSAGGMMIMPADVPHSVRAVERFKMPLTMIRG